MLQGLVANQGDGWQWFLDQLPEFFAAVAGLEPPAGSRAGRFYCIASKLHPAAMKHSGATMEAAALLGRRTAEMHLALATPSDDGAFAAEPFAAEDLARDARRIDSQIVTALDALKGKLPSLADSIEVDAALLLSRRRELIRRAHAIESLEARR